MTESQRKYANIAEITEHGYKTKLADSLKGQSVEFMGVVSHMTGVIFGLGIAKELIDSAKTSRDRRRISRHIEFIAKKELEGVESIIASNNKGEYK